MGKKKEPTHGLPRLRASQVSAAQPLTIIYLKPSKMSNGFYESGNNILWSNSQFILICLYKLFAIFLRQFRLSPFSYSDISDSYKDSSSLVCASSFPMISIVGEFNGAWHHCVAIQTVNFLGLYPKTRKIITAYLHKGVILYNFPSISSQEDILLRSSVCFYL